VQNNLATDGAPICTDGKEDVPRHLHLPVHIGVSSVANFEFDSATVRNHLSNNSLGNFDWRMMECNVPVRSSA
jgi:hypothetical protein